MRISAYTLLVTFYTIQEIHCNLMKEKDTIWLKSHEKFRKDFYMFKSKFEDKAALLIRDYLIYACASELIHSVEYCDTTIDYFFNVPIFAANDYTIENEVENIDIQDFIEKGQEVFYDGCWDPIFGGSLWGKALGYFNLYGKIPNEVFIDLCADLQHNSGNLFDKGFNISEQESSKLSDVLNKKFMLTSFIEWVSMKYHIALPNEVRKLLHRYTMLYITDERLKLNLRFACSLIPKEYTKNQMFDYLFTYEPLKLQGTKKFGDVVDSLQYRIENDLEDEDEYDY